MIFRCKSCCLDWCKRRNCSHTGHAVTYNWRTNASGWSCCLGRRYRWPHCKTYSNHRFTSTCCRLSQVAEMKKTFLKVCALAVRITFCLNMFLILFHYSLVGLAAVLTCVATYMHDFPTLATDPAANVLRTALLLGTYIGGVTFT